MQDIITQKELAKMLRRCTKTIRRWTQSELLPSPIRVDGQLVGWDKKDIDNWLEERKKA